jgi:hypothetical protein
MTVTIEIPVRASESGETLEELYRVSQREAEGVLRHHLDSRHFKVVGTPKFSHAIVKESGNG